MSFDRWVIVVGVITSLIVAISPVVITVIGKSAPRNSMKNTRVVQGMSVDVTSDFIEYLKNEVDEKEEKLEKAENKIRELRQELRLAHDVLNRNGLPIPVVYRPEND